MTDREKSAREYSQREVSDAESIRQHDVVQRAHEAGQRVGEARVREIVEEALINIQFVTTKGTAKIFPQDTIETCAARAKDALAKLQELDA